MTTDDRRNRLEGVRGLLTALCGLGAALALAYLGSPWALVLAPAALCGAPAAAVRAVTGCGAEEC